MARLRRVPRSEAPAEVLPTYQRLFGERDPVAEPGTRTGTPGNWWTTMALVPDIMRHFEAGAAMYRSPQRALPAYFREVGVLRTGFIKGSKFVFSQHCKAARAAGMSEEKVAAIPAWAGSDVFDARERAVLAYVGRICDV